MECSPDAEDSSYLLCASSSSDVGPFWTGRWTAGPAEDKHNTASQTLTQGLTLTLTLNNTTPGICSGLNVVRLGSHRPSGAAQEEVEVYWRALVSNALMP